MNETLTDTCKRLEHFETPEWAVKAILKKETMPGIVLDPCCGTGVLAVAAHRSGAKVVALDIHDWGYPHAHTADFLTLPGLAVFDENEPPADCFSVLMNPPFSKAVEFVEKSIELGAAKIVCFQRFAWWESEKRRAFWQKHPPCRVYICGHRADCWRHDIPHDQRGSSSPTAHAWFVWEQGQPAGTQLGHIYKGDA